MPSDLLRSLDSICEDLGISPRYLAALAEAAPGLYRVFDLPKKSGGVRTICVPADNLKNIQRLILDAMLSKVEMPEHVHGGVKGRSIATNAAGHVGKPLVINIDLADFFGSVSSDIVNGIFKSTFDLAPRASEIFTALTTYAYSLPQGAPTSSVLANLAALELDEQLMQICRSYSRNVEVSYSRYVDDITISGDRDLAIAIPELYKAINDNGFRTNPKKLKVAGQNYRQKVTGITVNEKASAPKKLIRKVRQQLHYCLEYGLDSHCERVGIETDVFFAQIKGMIGFIRMTRPELADQLDLQLLESKNNSVELLLSESAQKVHLLRRIIGKEKLATFVYNGIPRRVAPSELVLDSEGVMFLKAFQLEPAQRWQEFRVLHIESLAMVEA